MDSLSKMPFADLRIIDLSSEISGPYCTKLFVDGGATVIKIEAPQGDVLRRWRASGEPVPEGMDAPLFQFLNASKQSIALDLSKSPDKQILLDLIVTADVVIEDFAYQGLQKYGLSFEVFAEINLAISLVSISPWGLKGSYANRPASEFTLQAASGSMNSRGITADAPMCAGGRLGEWNVGTYAALAVVTSWLGARQSGRGQHMDVSAFEAFILSTTSYRDLASQWSEDSLGRTMEVPSIEMAKNGWVGFCIITGQQWLDFCAMIGRQDIADNEAYMDTRERSRDAAFIKGAFVEWAADKTVDEIIELSTLLRVPAAPVGTGKTVLDMDHLQEREAFIENIGGFKQPRVGFRLEKSAQRPLGAAPSLDEHRQQVLAQINQTKTTTLQIRDAKLPLKGLRVVDLTAFWAGPFATWLLSQFGADVVKVESIQRPDGMRFAGGFAYEPLWEWSPVYAGANTGKRDITLNLSKEEGIELLHKLIRDADILIENYSARVLDQFGLTMDVVRQLNPKTILVRMPAFGLDGPWRDRPGFAMNVEQVSGQAWVTGYEDIPLVPRGACDPLGGVHAFIALIEALEHRNETGEGQLVEVPLVEAALNIAAEQVIDYTAYGDELARQENRTKKYAPQGAYQCPGDNNWLAMTIENNQQWQILCELTEIAEFSSEKYAELSGRNLDHDQIDRLLETWFSSQDIFEIQPKLIELGIPAEITISGYRIMPNQQLLDRKHFYQAIHPATGETRYPGLPIIYSEFDRLFPRGVPPMLGEHNNAILGGDLGLSDEELAELREKKIIGERPSFM
jgi:crotonobetainyl-CoA:carnitine CoA-transferase CaiB-like acyl-CoA transferase